MISLMAGPNARRSRISRRDLVRLGAIGALGIGLPRGVAADTTGTVVARGPGKAKRCIYIFLCGGPSQLDMWDPKPEAPEEIRGPFKPIATKVPGIQIGELLPLIAQQTDKLAIIRSMYHDSSVHDIGILRTLLARKSIDRKPYPVEPTDPPALGAILLELLGTDCPLPPWVVLPRYFTTGDRFYKGQSAGFLGAACEPFELGTPKTGSLERTQFQLDRLSFGIDGIDQRRFDERCQLLAALERDGGQLGRPDETRRTREFYERAIAMLGAGGAKQAFEVTREPIAIRERYGMNEYGQSFLLARRLVEAGVRMVNVFWTFYGSDGCQFNLWDNHGSDKEVCGGANRGIDMIKHEYCCPSFDRAMSALVDDLDQRGLLDETLVVAVGEFGRTPKINKFAGRDHWGSCYSAVLAGGGVRGGQVYGESDKHTAAVKDSPVTPYDLHATVLHAFGLSPHATVVDHSGRPFPVSDGQPVTALF